MSTDATKRPLEPVGPYDFPQSSSAKIPQMYALDQLRDTLSRAFLRASHDHSSSALTSWSTLALLLARPNDSSASSVTIPILSPWGLHIGEQSPYLETEDAEYDDIPSTPIEDYSTWTEVEADVVFGDGIPVPMADPEGDEELT